VRYWRYSSWLRDGIVWAICLSMTITPFIAMLPVAYADEVIDEANKGQDTGANLLLNYQVPSISNAPPLDPLGPNELNIQELFPGFDPGDPSQLSTLSDLATDPADLSTQGVAKQFELQAGSDETAEAYQSANDGSNNPNYATIDMRNDNFLDRSREIISGNDPILDEILTACAEDVTAGDPGTDVVTRLEDIYTCSQLRTGTAGTCTVDRTFVLLPVATQVVLEVVGGTCTTGSGRDWSDWSVTWATGISAQSGGGTQWCRTTFDAGPDDWIVFGAISMIPFPDLRYEHARFCGEFDSGLPLASDCQYTARQLEHACRNAEHTGTLDSILINNSHPIFGNAGQCASYAPARPDTFDGSAAVDYTGCDADRVSFCTQAYDFYVSECNPVCGGTCTAGSGDDVSDHTGWSGWGGGPAPGCWRVQPGVYNEPWFGAPYPEAFIRLDNAATPGFPGWASTKFCGEFDTYEPTPVECQTKGGQIEHLCRNAPGITGGHSGQLNPNRGAFGSCGSYSFNPDVSTYNGTVITPSMRR